MNYPSVPVDEPTPPATLASRIASAALPALLALFLGALTAGVLGASVSGPPIFGVLIRVFFGLVVGGIAAWLATIAAQELRGTTPRAAGGAHAALPVWIAALCPACGRAAPEAQWCPFCEFPLGGRAEAWRADDRSWPGVLLALCLGAGLLCFGIFMTVVPMLEGERRVWAGIAFVSLGLLITAVGGLVLWAGGGMVADDLRGIRRWSYLARLSVPGASYHVSGSAVLARAQPVHAEGRATMELALDALRAARHPPSLLPAQQTFAHALSFLHHRGHLALWWTRATSWSIGAPVDRRLFRRPPSVPAPGAAAEGTMTMQLMMRFLASVPDESAKALLAALTPLAPGATPVAALWKTWRAAGAEIGPPPASAWDGEAVERAVAVEIGDAIVN